MILGVPIWFILAAVFFPKFMLIGSVIVCLLAAPVVLIQALLDGPSALAPKPKLLPLPPKPMRAPWGFNPNGGTFDRMVYQFRRDRWREDVSLCSDRAHRSLT